MKKALLIFVIGIALLLGLSRSELLWCSNVSAGVKVEGVDLGGKSRDDIRQVLVLWREEYVNRHLSLYYGDITIDIAPQNIDFDIDIAATVEEAWNIGHKGNVTENLKNIFTAYQKSYHVPLHIRYNESKLEAILDIVTEKIDRLPRNASFSMASENIIAQEQGRKVQREILRQQIVQALRCPDNKSLALPVTILNPQISVNDLAVNGIKEMVSKYATFFNTEDANRSANIALAARKINGQLVYPDQTFSFNEVVGPRTKETGFKEALEIVNGELVPGIGGGVCQVSSTLYNVALLANLSIIERYNHAKPLVYVPLGQDATVVFGVLDFKFKNTTASPLMIIAETEGNKLSIGIFSQQKPDYQVQILSVDKQVIPPATIKQTDPEMYLGETRVAKQGKPGYEITTVRVVQQAGLQKKREILSKDRYMPDHTIVKVGVKLPPFVSDRT